MRDRYNHTDYSLSGGLTVQPLDTSTLDRVFRQVCTVLQERTDYNVQNNRNFDTVRKIKQFQMKDAKDNWGLGSRTHLPSPLTVAEMNLIFHSDVLDFYTPFGLQALFYFFICVVVMKLKSLCIHNKVRLSKT